MHKTENKVDQAEHCTALLAATTNSTAASTVGCRSCLFDAFEASAFSVGLRVSDKRITVIPCKAKGPALTLFAGTAVLLGSVGVMATGAEWRDHM